MDFVFCISVVWFCVWCSLCGCVGLFLFGALVGVCFEVLALWCIV